MKRFELKDHIAGAVYGFAIGDSVGATTEFMSKDEIRSKYGEVTKQLGGGWLDIDPGEVTDDTHMMLCVMDALMKYPDDVDRFKHECASNFVKWLLTCPEDVGCTCREGIEFFMETGRCVEQDESKLGNGSLMRYLPCAILGLDEFNIAQGEITHPSSMCASLIQKTSEALRKSMMGEYTHCDFKGPQNPSDKVTDTFANAMWYASHGNFNSTLRGAVNDGGDADTIAAIACSLAGARVGLSSIDPKLIAPLSIDVKKQFGKFIDFSVKFLESSSNFLFTNRIE